MFNNATTFNSAPSGWTNDVRYSFDAAGNRTSVVAAVTGGSTNTTSYGVNNLNQYTNVNATAYTYDAKGNLTGDGVWTFSYDHENRLISATNTTATITYTYDATGRLIERSKNGVPVRYYYSGWQLIEERDTNDTVLAKYVYGSGIDEVVRMTRNGTNYFYHADALGSITEVTDKYGTLLEQYRYDVYGTPTIYDGAGNVLTTAAIGNRLLFTARDRDPDTGLYNYRYRWYSPTLGRFLQTDPLLTSMSTRGNVSYLVSAIARFGDMANPDLNFPMNLEQRILGVLGNQYCYVANAPVNSADPTGLMPPQKGIAPEICECLKKGGKWQLKSENLGYKYVWECANDHASDWGSASNTPTPAYWIPIFGTAAFIKSTVEWTMAYIWCHTTECSKK